MSSMKVDWWSCSKNLCDITLKYMELNNDCNAGELRYKAQELIAKLPTLIDGAPDESIRGELAQFMASLKEFMSMLGQEPVVCEQLAAEEENDREAIASNAEFEEAEDAAPTPQGSIVEDDPTTDPPMLEDDPTIDFPMVEDDPDTDPDEMLLEEDDEPQDDSDEPTEEKPHRDLRPMIRLFTLNDRYRFRRELFGNLDAAMAEALETLSVMTDIDQARTYLEDDLCWDMTLPEVEEFVAAITPYYSSGKL